MANARVEAGKLIKNYQKFIREDLPWRPFGSGELSIETPSINAIPEIAEVRKNSMLPVEYLSGDCVNRLRTVWTGNPLGSDDLILSEQYWHCYKITPHRAWSQWREIAKHSEDPKLWWALNLRDASKKYSWVNSDVGDFASLSLALQNAVSKKNDLYAAALCQLILRWGGVDTKAKGFLEWIYRHAANKTLSDSLVFAASKLVPQSNESLNMFDGISYFMDSSSTKIYSALTLDLSDGIDFEKQDLLIYDGRVAGAIGLIARRLLAASGVSHVPDEFMFPVERSSRKGRQRNPSLGNYRFPFFAYGSGKLGANSHGNRARFARLGSALIQEVIGIYGPSQEFLNIEKGLFMIGYDVT